MKGLDLPNNRVVHFHAIVNYCSKMNCTLHEKEVDFRANEKRIEGVVIYCTLDSLVHFYKVKQVEDLA